MLYWMKKIEYLNLSGHADFLKAISITLEGDGQIFRV